MSVREVNVGKVVRSQPDVRASQQQGMPDAKTPQKGQGGPELDPARRFA